MPSLEKDVGEDAEGAEARGSRGRRLPLSAPLWGSLAGALLLLAQLAVQGADHVRVVLCYLLLSGGGGLVWAWWGHKQGLGWTATWRGHGLIQCVTALPLVLLPQMSWLAVGLWLAGTAWLPWDVRREQPWYLPAWLGGLLVLMAMALLLALNLGVSAAPPAASGGRNLWLAAAFLPVLAHVLAARLAGEASRQHFDQELVQLSAYCEQMIKDVQQLQQQVGGLRQMSSGERDALTGVSSFIRIMEAVDALRERHARKREEFCVVLLALDPLEPPAPMAEPVGKGPSLQERMLLMVSGLLVTQLREVDEVGRYRDDIFMLVLPDTLAEQAVPALHRLRQAVSQKHWALSPTSAEFEAKQPLTLTIAVAEYVSGETSEYLVQRTYVALQRAHAMGRDQIVLAEDSMPPGPGAM
ncbi:diguanylate cyclase [Comamonas composti]|uniref:diguanylate cyclase n=1 Tax=Comamonas composti TaxID=408558 RepID=UPI000A009B02|nr:diguanylate cyclase [Comamonas composti]